MGSSVRLNLTFLPPASAKTAGNLDTPQNNVNPPHVALSASPGHTHTHCSSTIRTYANCTQEHNVFFRASLVYKFESKVDALRIKHSPTVNEARQEVHLNGFKQVPVFLT